MWGKTKKPIREPVKAELQPVDRLMFVAEELNKLSASVLATANEVRQELKAHAKNG